MVFDTRSPRQNLRETLLVPDGPLIDDAFHSDIDDYLATMKRILDIPVRVVHGGHFPSFDGGRYRELIRAYMDSKAV